MTDVSTGTNSDHFSQTISVDVYSDDLDAAALILVSTEYIHGKTSRLAIKKPH